MSDEEILADFPELEPEDIRACLAFAADREPPPTHRPGSRDGRLGIDITAPGQGQFASLGQQSAYMQLRRIQPQDGEGQYVYFGGASASAHRRRDDRSDV